MSQSLIQCIAGASRPLNPLPASQPPSLQKLTGIRAVLFDIYGTLFISGSGDVGTTVMEGASHPMQDAFQAVFPDPQKIPAADALTPRIQEAHARARAQGIDFPEVDIREIWREILVSSGWIDPLEEVCERLAIEYEIRVNPVWPMPRLEETLVELSQRHLKLGVVSNAQFYTPFLFPALTGRTLAEWGFEEDLCAWSWVHLTAKPSQVLFEQVLHKLAGQGIGASHVLYVGNDMRNDIWPAATLGCRTALFAGDARSLRLREDDPRVTTTKPDLVITGLSQLQECIPVECIKTRI